MGFRFRRSIKVGRVGSRRPDGACPAASERAAMRVGRSSRGVPLDGPARHQPVVARLPPPAPLNLVASHDRGWTTSPKASQSGFSHTKRESSTVAMSAARAVTPQFGQMGARSTSASSRSDTPDDGRSQRRRTWRYEQHALPLPSRPGAHPASDRHREPGPGARASTAAIAEAVANYRSALRVRARDHVVIASGRGLLIAAGLAWPGARLLLASGLDGAGQALLDAARPLRAVVESYDRVVIRRATGSSPPWRLTCAAPGWWWSWSAARSPWPSTFVTERPSCAVFPQRPLLPEMATSIDLCR